MQCFILNTSMSHMGCMGLFCVWQHSADVILSPLI